MVALGMAVNPALNERAAAHHDDRDKLQEIAEEALTAAKAHEAAGRGTAIHRITERIDLDGVIIETPLAAQVREQWAEALDIARLEIVPELVERIVVYPEHRIAGRFDRIARSKTDGRYVLLDIKSGANAIKYPHSVAIQLALYAYAPLMAGPVPGEGGTTTQFGELPDDMDRERAVVVHMPGDQPVQVVEIDIATAQRAIEQIVLPTLAWRARDDLVTPYTPPATTSAARVEWIRTRVQRIIDTGAGDQLAKLWSAHPEVPTFRQGGPTCDQHIDQIAAMCGQVEAEVQAAFGPTDPATPPATTIKKEKTTA
jgi:hypothetical protein